MRRAAERSRSRPREASRRRNDLAGRGRRLTDASAATNATLSGDEIGGSGGLTKAGAGVLTPSGISSYTGPTTVNAGTLRAAGIFRFRDEPRAGDRFGGHRRLQRDQSEHYNALAGTGALALNSASMTIGATNLSSVFNSTISGSGGTRNRCRILTLGGTNTFSGGVAVNGGGLSIGADTNLGSGDRSRLPTRRASHHGLRSLSGTTCCSRAGRWFPPARGPWSPGTVSWPMEQATVRSNSLAGAPSRSETPRMRPREGRSSPVAVRCSSARMAHSAQPAPR